MVILGAFSLFEAEPSAGLGRLSVLRPQGTFQGEGNALYFIYGGGYTTVLTYYPGNKDLHALVLVTPLQPGLSVIAGLQLNERGEKSEWSLSLSHHRGT